MFKNIFWFFLISIALFSISPHLFPQKWFIDIFSHFKVQYTCVVFFLLVLNLIRKGKIIANGFIVVLLVWNCFFVLPVYFSSSTKPSTSTDTISLNCINLLSTNTQYSQVRKYIKDTNADILVLLELNQNWVAELNDVLSAYSYRKVEVRSDNFGIAVFSKRDMDAEVQFFGNNSKPSIVAFLEINNEPLTIIATHPVPPVGKEQFVNRNKQLLALASQRSQFSTNRIVIGDLNTSSYSKHFQDFLKGADLEDSRKGFGILPSWPAAMYLFPMKTTLDHCLVGGDIFVSNRNTGSNIGSDHLPIYVEIAIE